jgi:hypothetical protein
VYIYNRPPVLPTITTTTTTTETTHSTAAGASLFIRAEQLPRQPPTAVTTASAPTYHDTATKLTAAAAFSLLPTITKTTTETTHSTAAGASLFIPRGTAGGSHHQPADDKNTSGDAPVYYGATPREVFRVGAEQLPRQPPTAVTTASVPTHHDTATKLTAAAAFSLLPTITKTTTETTHSTAAGASLFIPRGTAGGSHHQPADDKNASGDAPVYYGATPREVFRVGAEQLPRQPPTAVTTASAPTYHDTATKLTAAAAFSLLPTITKTTTETTHSTAAGASLFIPRGTAGGSHHQPADDKNASGDAPVYYGATPREVFRVGAEQLPRQPPTAVTTASVPTHHDTATKLTAAAAFSLLPTITKTTTETTHSTAAGASLFIPRGTAGGSHHQPADDKNASGDAPVYYGATPREVFRVGAEQLPRQPPTAVTTASAPTYHDTATKLTAAAAFSLLPTITKTTTETTHSTAAGASLFIPRGTAGGSHHQPADDKNASGDAPVYYGATPRERFRVDAGLPRQPPTAATAAPAPAHHDTALSATKPTATAASSVARKIKRATRRSKQSGGLLDKIRDTHHDTATKPTAAAAFSLLPTITTTKETAHSTAVGASLFIPKIWDAPLANINVTDTCKKLEAMKM